MNRMFLLHSEGSQFNSDLSKWDVSRVNSIGYMFGFTSFNGDISKWNVGAVMDMRETFANAPFNGDISNWNVGAVTKMKLSTCCPSQFCFFFFSLIDNFTH